MHTYTRTTQTHHAALHTHKVLPLHAKLPSNTLSAAHLTFISLIFDKCLYCSCRSPHRVTGLQKSVSLPINQLDEVIWFSIVINTAVVETGLCAFTQDKATYSEKHLFLSPLDCLSSQQLCSHHCHISVLFFSSSIFQACLISVNKGSPVISCPADLSQTVT